MSGGIQVKQNGVSLVSVPSAHPAPITIVAGVLCFLSFEGSPAPVNFTWSSVFPASDPACVLSSSTSPGPTFLPEIDGGAYSVTLVDEHGNTYVLDVAAPTIPVNPGTSGIVQFVTTVAGLRTQAGTGTNATLTTRCYSTLGDGGGQIFCWAPANNNTTSPDNGGSIIVPTALIGGTGAWQAQDTTVDVRQFGAVSGDATKDTINDAAFASAIAVIKARGFGELRVPGLYYVSQTVDISGQVSNFTIRGEKGEWGSSALVPAGCWLRVSSRFPLGGTLLRMAGVRSSAIKGTLSLDGCDETATSRAGIGLLLTTLGLTSPNRGTYDVQIENVLARRFNQGLSGAAATITAFDGATKYQTLTGLSGMTAGMVGRSLLITGAASEVNTGDCLIVAFISASSVKVYNTEGLNTDANNGAIAWRVSAYGIFIGCPSDPAQANASLQCDTITVDHYRFDDCTIGLKQQGNQTTAVEIKRAAGNVGSGGVGFWFNGGNIVTSGTCEFEMRAGSIAGVVVDTFCLTADFGPDYFEVPGGHAYWFRSSTRNSGTILRCPRVLMIQGGAPTGKFLKYKQDGPLVILGAQWLCGTNGVDVGDVALDSFTGGTQPMVTEIGSQYINGATRTRTNGVGYIGFGVQGPVGGAYGNTTFEINNAPLQLVTLFNSDNALFLSSLPTNGAYCEATTGRTVFTDGSRNQAVAIDATLAAGDTCLLLRRNVGGVFTVQRVSMGVVDSGGAGFKLLRVPN